MLFGRHDIPDRPELRIDNLGKTFLTTCIRSNRFIGMSVSGYHPNLDTDLMAASILWNLSFFALLSEMGYR